MASPPKLPGTYALILQAVDRLELSIGKDGRFGTLVVEPGFLVYAGTARGSGGLASRIDRHLRNDAEKPLKWHIDYLRAVTQVVEAWWTAGEEHRECDWVRAFGRMRDASVPMTEFGASDCTSGCPAHLHWFPTQPRVRTFRKHLAEELGVPIEHVKIRVQRFEGIVDLRAGAGRTRL